MAKQKKTTKAGKKTKEKSIPVDVPTENLIVRLQLKDIAVSKANSIRIGLETLLENVLGKQSVTLTESLNFSTKRPLRDIVRRGEAATTDDD